MMKGLDMLYIQVLWMGVLALGCEGGGKIWKTFFFDITY